MTLKNEDFEAVYEALYGKDALAEAKARVREQVLTEALDAVKQRQLQAAAEAHWAEHGCTENDHDWVPHEDGRLCRRCRGWNAIVTL